MKDKIINNYIQRGAQVFLLVLLLGFAINLNAQNYALSFDGSGDYINFGNPEELRISGDQTIEMWLHPTTINARRNPMAKAYGGEGTITFETNGSLNYYYGNNGGNGNPYQGFNNEFPISINEWTHIAIVRDLTNMKLYWYINGALVNTVDASYSYATKGSNSFYIGRGYVSDFKGLIDDVRVWNIAKSHSEIALYKNAELTGNETGLAAYWNFNEGTGNEVHDATPNGINGNIFGNTFYTSEIPPVFQYSQGNELFEPVTPTGLPYNIILSEVLLNDSLAPMGTQIGVFDGELCVGTAIYNGTPNQALIAWQADPSQNMEGFTPGNTMSFKYHTYWYSEIKNFDASADFSVGDGTFGDGPYSVAGLSATTDLAPEISISNDVINFNALTINESASLPLVISNGGSAVLHLQSFENNDSHFSFSNTPMFIAPSENDTLWITFVPTEALAYEDVLLISSDDPDLPLVEIPLHGLGLPLPIPQATLSPSFLDFEGIPVNTTKTLTMNILNNGSGALQVSGISISNAAFTVVEASSFTLENGQNRNVEVQFAPEEAGAYQGNLTVQTNNGNLSMPLSGVASQGHFASVEPTGLPYPIIVEDVDVNGFRPTVGDEVAVFDDTLCVGLGNFLNCKSVSFDGSGDYINATQTTYPKMTMEAWAKINASETNGEIAGFTHTNADQQYGFSFRIVGDYLHAKAATNNDAYFYNNVYTNISNYRGEWTHFAMTWENLQGTTAEVKLFVNGQMVDSDIHTFPSSPYDPTVPYPYPFSMGGCYSNSQTRMFTGMVDEVRVWDIARKESDIQADMNRSLIGNETGLVGYWNFDDNTANDLTSFGNDGTMHGNATIANDCKISNIHITAWEKDDELGYPGFTPGNPMSFKLFTEIYDTWVELDATADFSVGNGNFGNGHISVLTLEASAGLEPDIDIGIGNLYVGQLTLGETATKGFAIKNTGNAPLHITVSENSDVFSSSVSQATIEAGDSLLCNITFTPNQTGGFTGELLIESNDPDEDELSVLLEGFALPAGAANISTSVDQLNFGNVEIDSTKSLSFFVINTGTTSLTVSGITSDNPEYTVSPESFTLENTNDLMEVLLSFKPLSKGISNGMLSINSNATQKQISMLGVGFENYFDVVGETGLPYYIIVEETNLDEYIQPGDELAVFDGDLCVGEAGINLDANNQSAKFDGNGDYIEVEDSDILDLDVFSISFYLKTAHIGNDQGIMSKYDNHGEWNYQIFSNSTGHLRFNIGSDNSWSRTLTSNSTINDGEWHHIAVLYDQNQMQIFIDGNLDNAVNENRSCGFSDSPLYFGTCTYNANSAIVYGEADVTFSGFLDEISFWGRALTVLEITNLTHSFPDKNEPGLIGYWSFNADYLDKSSYNHNSQSYGNTVLFYSTPDVFQNDQFSILAWQKDVSQGLPGFTPGNAMTFKLWTELNGIPTQLDATPSYLLGNGNFGDGQFTVATLEFLLPEISIEPEEIFAALEEPDSTEQTIVLTNPGVGNLDFLVTATGNQWLTISPLTGTIPPDGSKNINAGFNTDGLNDGLYEAVIVLENNSISTPTVEIPVVMNVTGNPQIASADTLLDFANVGVNDTAIKTFELRNIGSKNLVISEMIIANQAATGFYFESPQGGFPITLAPAQIYNLNVSFVPPVSGMFSDSLFIISNAENNDSLLVMLMGTGITPPEILVSQTTQNYSLACKGVFVDSLLIKNQGEEKLYFQTQGSTPWLSSSPATDSVAGGDSLWLKVNISTVDLFAGNHFAVLSFNSNDPASPVVEIPYQITVYGEPEILANGYIDLGIAYVGDTLVGELLVANNGCDTLQVNNVFIENQQQAFLVNNPEFSVAPGSAMPLFVSFIPETTFQYSGIINILSNDPSNPQFQVVIDASGVEPPEMVVSPLNHELTLQSGDIEDVNALVQNSGGETLIYESESSNLSSGMIFLDGAGDYINVVHNDVLNPTDKFTLEAWIYLNDNTNEFIAGKENTGKGNYRLFVNEDHRFEFELNKTNVLVSQSYAVKNQWVHVAASFDGEWMRIFVNGNLNAEMHFEPFSIQANAANLRIGRSYQYEYLNGKMDEVRLWNMARNESEIQSVMNQALTGNEPELLLYFQFPATVGNIVNDASTYGNNGILYGNPSRQISNIPFTDYLSIPNPNGFLSAGQSRNLNVELNSTGLLANDYYREVVVSSNAIENPVDTIALEISIQGDGIVAPEPTQLQFEETFVGLTDTLEIILTNSGASSAGITDISFSSDAFFAIGEVVKIFPFSQKQLRVIFEPGLVQQYNEVLTIELSNANTGQITIPLSALGLAPPVPVLSPDSIDFGEVVINFTGTESVELSNLGSSSLEVYGLSLSNPAIFNTDISLPLALDFNQSGIFEVSFSPNNYNVAEGEIVFSTNIGKVTLTLTGIGTPPNHDLAVVEILSPASWCGMGDEEQLTVKIQNFGVLEQSTFDIGYSLNGGNTVVESIDSLLPSGNVMEFTFAQELDLSIPGTYDLQVFTLLPNDENTINDALQKQIINSPVVGEFTTLLPADSSFGVLEPVSFSWNSVPNASTYDLYLWRTNQQKPGNPTVEGINTTSFVYYDYLNKNYLYNWQVVARNQCSQSESSIQMFSFNVFSDLMVSEIAIPDTGYSGDPVSISFTIKNIGIGATGFIPWKDKVFISNQQVFNPETAISVAQTSNLSSLSSGQSYTRSLNFDLPDYMGGPHYVFVQTDINNKIQETNESNNQQVSEDFIQIILPPYPDLLVSGVQSANDGIVPGGTISAGWNIENIGSADAIGGWSQRVSLIGGQQRKILGYLQFTDTLSTGGIIAQNASFEIPEYPGMDGEIFIEVLLTPYPDLLETPDGEENNLALSTESITMEKVISISATQQAINEDATNPLQVFVYRSGFVYNHLDVTILSSDTSRLAVPEIVTIPAGQSGKAFYINAINNDVIDGNAEIEITAEENSYGAASANITVIDDEVPSLALNINVNEVIEGGQFEMEITRDFVTNQPLLVSLSSSNDQQLELPDEATIEADEVSVIIFVDVTNDNVPELNEELSIYATVPGYNSASSSILIIDNDIPQVELSINPESVSESGGPYAAWGTLSRLEAGDDPVTIVLSASMDGQLFFPTQVIIPADVIEKQFMISVYDNGVLDGDREIEIEAAIYLSSCGCGVPEESGGTDTAMITIIDDDGPALSAEANPNIVPEAKTNAGKLLISRNTVGGGGEIQVAIVHDGPDEIEIPVFAIIPEGLDVVEVPFNTLDDGIEDGEQIVSISVSAEGYSMGSCWVVVSDRNIPDFIISGFEISSDEILVNESVDVNIEVKNIGFAPAPSGAKVNIYKSSDNVLDAYDAVISTLYTSTMLQIGGTEALSHTMNANENVEDFYLLATVNKDEALTELVTVNNQSGAKSLSVLPDYSATAFVEGDVFNGLSPITITGIAEMASKTPAANKPVDVYVIVNGVRRVFKVSSDENGEFGVDFIPLNGEAGDYTVGACYPNVVLSDAQDSFVLLGAKSTANDFIIWELHEGETQQKVIGIKNLSSLPLNNVQVEILSSPQGCNLNFAPIPSLQGNAYGTINCTVNATEISNGNYYEEVELRLVSSEGTQYDFSAWFYCFANTGNLKLNPVSLNEAMVTGQINYVEFTVTNNGLDETGLINIDLPEAYWLNLACPDTISSLQPGQSAVVTLKLMPDDDLQLNNPITGSIALSGSNSNSVSLPFTFEPISEETGDLLVDVVDEYTYNTQSAPHLEGANVLVSHPYTGQIIAQGTTDVNGHFLVEDINEGYYTLKVEAPMHSSYQDYVYVEKGTVNQELVFVAFQAITYSWNVVPTYIEDEYEINLEVEYETNVPVPVVLMDMPGELPHLEEGEFFPFILTLTNVGMITAEEVEVIFPDDEEYMFTANVDVMDILPQQSIQVPVVMEVRPPEEKSGKWTKVCMAITNTKYKFECGPDDQMRMTTVFSQYLGRLCIPIPGNVFSNIPWIQPVPPFAPDNGSGNNGQEQQNNVNNSGPTLPLFHQLLVSQSALGNYNPYGSINQGCDPCVAIAKNIALARIGIGSPVGMIVNFLTLGIVDYDCWADTFINDKGFSGGLDCVAGMVDVFGIKQTVDDVIALAECYTDKQTAQLVYNDMLMFQKAGNAIENNFVENVGNDEMVHKGFFANFLYNIAGFVDAEIPIDPNSQNDILDAFVDTDITESEINDFFEYWNTSMEARDNGIFSPTPEYPDIIDTLQLHNNSLVLDTVMQYVYDRGYPSMDSLFKASVTLFGSIIDESSTAVCASVSVQFSQTLTMTREVFEGTLSIFNGHETDAMENIQLNLEIRNENGDLCNDLFEITTLALNQISGIDGTGILEALETGEAVIRFIPERGAAPEIAQSYSFGGTLSYYDPFNSEIVEQILFPVVLQVNPSPDLYIDYFMQRDIFGDDALTEPVEPMIPAELAVMIDNRGAGTAWNVNIESAQPEIIGNEKGLLIDFNIIGSNLGGEPTQLGLLDVNFGTIAGGDIQVGQWWFTSSLLGHFISYDVSVNHLDSWGNPDLSLVSEVNIHELIHGVTVYGAFNDSVGDFLVNDIPDADDLPDALFYSNGIVAEVVQAESAMVDAPVTLSDTVVELSVSPSDEGWNYTKINDPGNGLYRIVSCTRSDNQIIPLTNIWLTYSTIPDGGEPIYENKLHFTDYFESSDSQTYTVVFEPIDQDVPEVLAINGIPEGPTDIPVENVEVVFSEPIDTDSFTYEDMTLKNQAGPNLMDTLVVISQINDSTFNVDISDKTTLNGYYTFTVQAAGISDLSGNLGKDGMQVGWLQSVATPAIDYFFGIPEVSGEPIDTLLVLFNMPINTETFTNSQLILEDGEGNVLPVETLVVSSESFNDVLFKISGLASLASEDGSYTLTFKLTEIQGENGQAGVQDQSIEWGVCQIPLPVANAGNNDSICVGATYLLSGQVQNAGSFYWTSSGSGSFDNPQILNPVYSPSQEEYEADFFELTLTAEPLNACAASVSSTITIHISNLVYANAGADVLICEKETHELYGTIENADDFNWITFGDGSFSNAQQLTPVYTPGEQDIQNTQVELALVALPVSPCILADTSLLTINIQPSPLAYAGSDNTSCIDAGAQLQATVGNYTSFLWIAAGDGTFNSPTILNPIYSFGSRDIKRGYTDFLLIVRPESPCFISAYSTVRMTIQTLPLANAGDDATICENQTHELSAVVANQSSFLWETDGDGSFDNEQILNPVYYPGSADIQAGAVNISLTAQPFSPCALPDVSTKTLEIQHLPQANAGEDATICENQTHELSAVVANQSSFLWETDGDGSFDDEQILNPVYYPGSADIQAGAVNISLTAQPFSPCALPDVSTKTLEIQHLPQANAGDAAVICENQTHQLSGVVANQNSFLWETEGDGSFDDEQILNPVYYPGFADIQAGAVNISLTAQPLSPCALPDVSTKILEIQHLPQANAGDAAVICENQTHQLSGVVANQNSFLWETEGDGSFDDEQILNPVYYPGFADIQAGAVNISLTVQPLSPCALPDVSTKILEIQHLPQANAGEDAVICENQTHQLSGVIANHSSFVWESQGDGTFDDEQILNPVYYPGFADIQAGAVNISLTTQPFSPCALSDVSTKILEIQHLPQANAGEDAVICNDENILLNGYVENSGLVFWSTGGDGTFENENANTTSYYPGDGDVSSGEVQLILSALPISPCLNSADDEVILTIHHCLDLSLPEGWSGVSSYVEPLEPDMQIVFLNAVEDLIILQSQNGIYWPGQNINTIGLWNTSEGYSIKMIANSTLSIIGSRSVSNSLLLETDWNLMPVLSECPTDVAELFNGKDVSIVKEVAGWRTYWPAFGINTLQVLEPGKAYFTLMGSEEDIVFPECTPSSRKLSGSPSRGRTGTLSNEATGQWAGTPPPPGGGWVGVNPTAISHNIALPASANNNSILAKGDIIGVFDNAGNCYGLAEWNGTNTALTVFGNDPLSSEKDGFDQGETMVFKFFKTANESEITLDVEFDYAMPQGNAFANNGLSAISNLKAGSTEIETPGQVQQSQIVPNPAHDAFNLILDLTPQSTGKLELYNLKGQLMKQLTISGQSTKVEIDDLSAGVYVVNILIDNQTMVKQLIKH